MGFGGRIYEKRNPKEQSLPNCVAFEGRGVQGGMDVPAQDAASKCLLVSSWACRSRVSLSAAQS